MPTAQCGQFAAAGASIDRLMQLTDGVYTKSS